MKSIALFISILLANGLCAQFYYQDIVTTRQTNQLYKQLRTADTRKISATSFENDNEISKDFELEQTISADGKEIVTRSASINNLESYFISYYANNRLSSTLDSSRNAINRVNYFYDGKGKISSISSMSKDFDGTFISTETHMWTYNDQDQPTSMLKIKNGADSTNITFSYDDQGNVSEERWQKNNRTIETYYYYYNAAKQLTDVVRYNSRAGKLLPDLMFEYDQAGHISSMTQTQGGIANYLIWSYTYNSDGLKTKEVVYGKKRELMGRIEYKYR